MKLRNLDLTANIAWSPLNKENIYLACGTAAQQLDATFNTTSCLELYSLDLSVENMPKVASISVEHRFHKLIWGDHESGRLAGGCNNGLLMLYDIKKLLHNEPSIIFANNKHTGSVQAMDFNLFKPNLLATGATESEIYIWDLNKPENPMMPGAKIQPVDEIRSVAWNKQVSHILATTLASRCVVWDLRKNDPIIKLSEDSGSRMRFKVVAWHPDVATQLCLASEDDPNIQVWDLRSASSPIRTLQNHRKGIMSIAWCQQDADLLISCGKDNRILCWNPNIDAISFDDGSATDNILLEIPTTTSSAINVNNWSFDIQFCPRNPALFATGNCDGHVSIYSLLGSGNVGANSPQTSSNLVADPLSDSFPGLSLMPLSRRNSERTGVFPASSSGCHQLKKAPKWLNGNCGANFGFGGKLVVFCPSKELEQSQRSSVVTISSQFDNLTDDNVVIRSRKLQISLQNGNMREFVADKIYTLQSEEKTVEGQHFIDAWAFISAYFEVDCRKSWRELLGRKDDSCKNLSDSALVGDDLYLSADQNIDSIVRRCPEDELADMKFFLPPENDLISYLLDGNIQSAVEYCVKQGEWADAFVLANSSGNLELIQDTQDRYFSSQNTGRLRLIQAVTSGYWENVVKNCDITQWKKILCAISTYCESDTFMPLCNKLGFRLSSNQENDSALLCFICAGDLDGVVDIWEKLEIGKSPSVALQDIIDIIITLRSALVGTSNGPTYSARGCTAQKLIQYSYVLAAQGEFEAALTYLGDSTDDQSIVDLRNRLNGALNTTVLPTIQAPSHTNNLSSSYSANQFSYASAGDYSYGLSKKNSLYSNESQRGQTGMFQPAQVQLTTSKPAQVQLTTSKPAQPKFNTDAFSGISSGWNDPPSSSMVGRAKKSGSISSAAPITQPLMGSQQGMAPPMAPADSASFFGVPPLSNTDFANTNMQQQSQHMSSPFVPNSIGIPNNYHPSIQSPLIPNSTGVLNNFQPLTLSPMVSNSVGISNSFRPPPPPPSQSSILPNTMGLSSNLHPPPQSPLMSNSMGVSNNFQPPPQSSTMNNNSMGIPNSFQPPPPPPSQSSILPNTMGLSSNLHPPPQSPFVSNSMGIPNKFQNQSPLVPDKLQNQSAFVPNSMGITANFCPPPLPQTSVMSNTMEIPSNFASQSALLCQNNFQQTCYDQQPSVTSTSALLVENMTQQTGVISTSPLVADTGHHQPLLAPVSTEQAIKEQDDVSVPNNKQVTNSGKQIPPDDMILQEVFEGLRLKCLATANHPQIRRKLEDVGRKLDILYEKLAANSLSSQTKSSLHEFAKLLQTSGQIPAAMLVYTSMVSGPSFTDIVSFMPSLKVLVQVAQQNKVTF